MENQHRKITGYKDFNQDKINKINYIKKQGNDLKESLDSLEELGMMDPHDLQMSKDHLQIGIMYAVRALAQPSTFC